MTRSVDVLSQANSHTHTFIVDSSSGSTCQNRIEFQCLLLVCVYMCILYSNGRIIFFWNPILNSIDSFFFALFWICSTNEKRLRWDERNKKKRLFFLTRIVCVYVSVLHVGVCHHHHHHHHLVPFWVLDSYS